MKLKKVGSGWGFGWGGGGVGKPIIDVIVKLKIAKKRSQVSGWCGVGVQCGSVSWGSGSADVNQELKLLLKEH